MLRLEVGKLSIYLRSLKLERRQKMCIVLWQYLISLEAHCHVKQNVKIRRIEFKLVIMNPYIWERLKSPWLWKKTGLIVFCAPPLNYLDLILQYLCWSCSRTKVIIFFLSFLWKTWLLGPFHSNLQMRYRQHAEQYGLVLW